MILDRIIINCSRLCIYAEKCRISESGEFIPKIITDFDYNHSTVSIGCQSYERTNE